MKLWLFWIYGKDLLGKIIIEYIVKIQIDARYMYQYLSNIIINYWPHILIWIFCGRILNYVQYWYLYLLLVRY